MTINDFKDKIVNEYNFQYINEDKIHKFYGDYFNNHIIIVYDENKKDKIKLAMCPVTESLSEDDVKSYPFNLSMIEHFMKLYK